MRIRIRHMLQIATVLIGCNQPSQQEQQQERRELAEQQSEERTRLQEEQREERQEAAGEAGGLLAEQSQALREQRMDMVEELRELDGVVAQACAGVAAAPGRVCPVDAAAIGSVQDVRGGVIVHTRLSSDTREGFDRNVSCYVARSELAKTTQRLRPSIAAPAVPCVVNAAATDVEVDEHEGHLDVRMTSEAGDGERAIRLETRQAQARSAG